MSKLLDKATVALRNIVSLWKEAGDTDPSLMRDGLAVLDEVDAAPRVEDCIYPGCCNSRRTRGLCHQHYQTMRSYVRDGKATEADLEARCLLLGKGTGGSPVAGHDAFLLGSDVRGDEQ